ncbi:TonB family protein [Affinibrenneria salicis]|uniref:Protein TonB n=1 Tax=Affinibrenneria salicis TaxID=2590031 RepID=A0A5J5G7P5_9GAMM|nr:TonB family protein [Affinibrenneria salicis]KAA9002531.1 TonB family protein [Affinibrenneria salicis]KAA9003181.1 TonB family protein [Affinibrenneria salicis]
MMKSIQCIPSLCRRAGFLSFSALLHLGLITLALWAARTPPSSEALAGKAGDSLNITMLQIQHAEQSAGQTAAAAAPARAAAPEGSTMPAASEIALPLADKPRIVVRQAQPVTASAKKPAQVPVKKTPEKAPPVRQPSPRASEAPQTAERSTRPSPDAPASSSPVSTGSAGRLAASAQGSSNSGQAAQGTGAASTQKLTALNRRVNYPTRARSLGVEGRVRVRFDVTGSGTVTNIRILTEDPVGVFAASVMKDMARWRYQAQTMMADQTVSIVFKLDGHIRLEN